MGKGGAVDRLHAGLCTREDHLPALLVQSHVDRLRGDLGVEAILCLLHHPSVHLGKELENVCSELHDRAVPVTVETCGGTRDPAALGHDFGH